MERILQASTPVELSALDKGDYSGVIFGAEFCPHLLPTIEDVSRAAKVCRGRGLSFRLMTPPVREANFEKVSKWLKEASSHGDGWVCNDWGILTRAAKEGLGDAVVGGRLLSRQRRGPRTLGLMEGASECEVRALRSSVWNDPFVLELAMEMGVTAIMLDATLQGVERPPTASNIPLYICGPWVPVTLQIACPWNPETSVTPEKCSQPCLKNPPVELANPQNPVHMHSRGNAQFMKVDKEIVEKRARETAAAAIVWSECMPA